MGFCLPKIRPFPFEAKIANVHILFQTSRQNMYMSNFRPKRTKCLTFFSSWKGALVRLIA